MKELIRKFANWLLTKTSPPNQVVFDSEITAMHTWNGCLVVAVKSGKLYVGDLDNGRIDWRIY